MNKAITTIKRWDKKHEEWEKSRTNKQRIMYLLVASPLMIGWVWFWYSALTPFS